MPIPQILGVPYKTLPNEDEYDYYNAYEVPERQEHWSSRNPTTGRILKSDQHPTFQQWTVPNEYEAGYEFYTDPLGNLYSFNQENDSIPYLQRPLMTRRTYENPKSTFSMDPDELALRMAYMESGFNPKAKSEAGAMGMFQIMPDTIKKYQKLTGDIGDPYDPQYSKRVKDWLINRLYKVGTVINGNPSEEVKLAKMLAAYNWGIGNLEEVLVDLKNQGKDIYSNNSWMDDSRIPTETKNYINFILYHKPTKAKSDEELAKLKHLYDGIYTNR